jgi:integration host factor subunit beta
MLKSELIQKIAESNPHILHGDISKSVNLVFDKIADALEEGGRAELRGFGSFSLKHRGARKARNPRSGKEVRVAEKCIPFFRSGRDLKSRLNRN